eukprot:m.63998 g.63998  ORF g.63998 m.63998 type:complete len:398 (+) comp11985_c0_seq1:1404-2597(+)
MDMAEDELLNSSTDSGIDTLDTSLDSTATSTLCVSVKGTFSDACEDEGLRSPPSSIASSDSGNVEDIAGDFQPAELYALLLKNYNSLEAMELLSMVSEGEPILSALLALACKQGDIAVVDAALIKAGITSKGTSKSLSPLFYAAEAAQLDLLKWMVERDSITVRDLRSMANLILRTCCELGHDNVVVYLLDNFNFHSRDVRGGYNACLRAACSAGNLTIVKTLADKFSLTARDARFYDCQALRHCLVNGHVHVAVFLIRKFDLTLEDVFCGGCHAIRTCISQGHYTLLQFICDHFGSDAVSAAFSAAQLTSSLCLPAPSATQRKQQRAIRSSISDAFPLPEPAHTMLAKVPRLSVDEMDEVVCVALPGTSPMIFTAPMYPANSSQADPFDDPTPSQS